MDPLNVGILLYENVGLLDFAGPMEVLSSAALPRAEKDHDISLFNPIPIGKTVTPIVTSTGLHVMPNQSFDEVKNLDLLLVPGGPGALSISRTSDEVKFIGEMAENVELVATVSTGLRLALLAGLGSGKRVVTHHAHAYEFSKEFSDSVFDPTYRYLDEDTIITSAGSAAGIDLAMYLVYKFFGDEAVQYTSRKIDYIFTP